jgi:Kef-type K+ transport system membrane component KefB
MGHSSRYVLAFSGRDRFVVDARSGIIIIFTQLLSIPLARIRQPRVIAEVRNHQCHCPQLLKLTFRNQVISGVILGPTAMGRIPHFSFRIFPPASLPYLNLTATVGLVLFLFLVGLEVDTRIIRRNARTSLAVSAAGILLPFGLGAAAAVPIYNKFIDAEKASFGHFILFTGVAISITAFPVLCRILTETKLLDTTVGVIVLAAGVGNDVIGWVLLALTVALVNASSGLTALYILLAAVGGTLFLMYPVRWGFVWLAHRTGSIERGQPTPLMVTATILLVFSAAFFTDVIGRLNFDSWHGSNLVLNLFHH